jgi:hypothetical protein
VVTSFDLLSRQAMPARREEIAMSCVLRNYDGHWTGTVGQSVTVQVLPSSVQVSDAVFNNSTLAVTNNTMTFRLAPITEGKPPDMVVQGYGELVFQAVTVGDSTLELVEVCGDGTTQTLRSGKVDDATIILQIIL